MSRKKRIHVPCILTQSPHSNLFLYELYGVKTCKGNIYAVIDPDCWDKCSAVFQRGNKLVLEGHWVEDGLVVTDARYNDNPNYWEVELPDEWFQQREPQLFGFSLATPQELSK